MTETVRDVMTIDPVTVKADEPVTVAAQAMKAEDIGDVIVVDEGNQVIGILTDRDIAVRLVAEQKDYSTKIGEICTTNLETVSPDDSIARAVKLMSSKAIRRLPVIEEGRPVGIVSLGDLAVEEDPDSALADISQAPPNE